MCELYVNKDEIKDNISWCNLRSVEWQNNTMHIVFISNFATTDDIDYRGVTQDETTSVR